MERGGHTCDEEDGSPHAQSRPSPCSCRSDETRDADAELDDVCDRPRTADMLHAASYASQ